MLARPEINTKEYILLWLASKDPNEKYDWYSSLVCPCGKYSLEHHADRYWWHNQKESSPIQQLNRLAFYLPHTYGALYKRARMTWETS